MDIIFNVVMVGRHMSGCQLVLTQIAKCQLKTSAELVDMYPIMMKYGTQLYIYLGLAIYMNDTPYITKILSNFIHSCSAISKLGSRAASGLN